MRSIRRTAIIGAVAAAIIAGSVATYASAQNTTAVDEQQPLVEDFSYPDADRIATEREITLIKGDGHMVLVDCVPNATGQIALRSSAHSNLICFKVTGSTGRLSLSLPEVYSIRGDGTHSGEATVTTDDGATTSKTPIGKNAWTPINAGDGATLLELRAWT
ncbi:hypothetical protein [Saccharothrix obliqua]|uniref:hypothetical protein n=1 Tax=Saccharothrix obliqua TaxID=2861747 RepID=UPI001C5F1BD9|nr:hypothetical protein [Saccharothrix obliqua]MBW4721359.1 hypothetical protein [Saccharothrix obliqua]